jgi:hypothetical protein
MWRWFDDCAAEQSRIKTCVGTSCPRGPPAGLLAWHGKSAPPKRRGRSVHVPELHHVVRLVPWSEAETARANEQLVVRGGDLSFEAETCRSRRRLVVRGGDLSCEAETCRRGFLLWGTSRRSSQLVGNKTSYQWWSWQGCLVLLVLNLGLHIVNGVRRLHLKRDCLAVKGGPNPGPRQLAYLLILIKF